MTDEEAQNIERRKAGYKLLEERLDRFETHLDERLHGFFVKMMIAFALLGFTSVGAAIGAFVALNEIQDQRYNSLLESCQDQNDRNARVNNEINKALMAIPPGPKHDRAEKNTGPFRLIISAAVPHTDDCAAFAADRIKGD